MSGNTKNLYELREGAEKLKEIELALAYIQEVLVAISNLAISGDIISDVHANLAEIDICAQNITEIVTVSDNIIDVNTVATNIDDVVTCATSIVNINTVATNIANVNIVAGINDDITTLSLISNDITTVAGISDDVSTVAGDTLAINDLASEPLRSAVLDTTTEPLRQSIIDAGANATDAQLEAWNSEAEAMTSESNASEAVSVFTKTYTSVGDGTFSSVNNAWYSALHYASISTSGGTERTSARNTVISSPNGVLALATTPTPSFNTVIYTGNGTSQDIVTGLESRDANWISGTSYAEFDFVIEDYVIYVATADTSGTTLPSASADWAVVAPNTHVPFNNSKVWVKHRGSLVRSHAIFDTLRSGTQLLASDTTSVEAGSTEFIKSFNVDGFTIGNNANVNESTYGFVVWQTQYDTMFYGTTNQGKKFVTAYNAQSGKV